MIKVYYHAQSSNGTGKERAQELKNVYPDEEIQFIDIAGIKDMYDELQSLPEDVRAILSGGDGMLNKTVNSFRDRKLTRDLYYYASGTGNDFYADIKDKEENGRILLNPYIENLPEVTVNGLTYKFINGIGYGLDGYCCEEGDRQRAEGKIKINYSGIAIKGLLMKYKPTGAKVTVDGKTTGYKKAWLVPTMNGRFYGGGIQIAPKQDRLDADGKITVVTLHDVARLHALAVFPKVIAGQHLGKKCVASFSGYDITVEFDRPTALQIDGETILGVTSYRCTSKPRTAVQSEEKQEQTV